MIFDKAFVVRWCTGCSAEQATDVVEMQINGQWIPIDVGPDCLTRLKEQSRIDL